MGVIASRRAEHALDTRRALIEAARDLFAADGYAATSIDEIAGRARVTKGALYHHFADKRELFRAVCERIQREWVDDIHASASAEPDPGRRLELGLDAFLEACLDPAGQRIVLIDGPAVLGWDELHAVDERYGLGMISKALGDAMDSGDLARGPVEPIAHLILGALNSAAMAIARSPEPAAARAEIGAALERLVGGLRARA